MSSTKQDYRNNKKNNKTDRKQQQKSKSFKNSSLENQDIPEGMYNMSLKPTSDELSYVYHEKEEKTYSNDCSDLLGINKSNEEDIKKEDIKKEDIKKEDNMCDLEENAFDEDYFTPVAYVKKIKK